MSMTQKAIVRGESLTLRYQIKEDGAAKDITGMTFKLGVKAAASDTTYRIGPVDGAIDDAATGRFSFTLTSANTDVAPFAGVIEAAMYDSEGNKTVLSPAGGLSFRLMESIID